MKNITIKIDGYIIQIESFRNGGTIKSNLKENCPICGAECYGACESISSGEVEAPEDLDSRRMFNTAMDAVESVVLAHACAGLDVQSKEYVEGLKTAIEAISNNV